MKQPQRAYFPRTGAPNLRQALPLFALFAAACAGGGGEADGGTRIPLQPGGYVSTVYNVHLETRPLVDTSRGTPANGTAPALEQRNLTTDLRVPVPQADAGVDVPLAYPLVLFVHGSSSGRATSTFLLDGLAAHGYATAAADFPLTALDTPGGASDWYAGEQVNDLKFLADTLFAAAANPADDLYGKLDTAKGYAVVGHSTGGTIAILAAQAPTPHDARVNSAVALSGDSCFLADSLFSTRAVPMLFIGGTADQLVPYADNVERAFRLAAVPALYGLLDGGTHLFFTDLPLPDTAGGTPHPTTPSDPLAQTLMEYGGGTACALETPGPATLSFDEQHALTLELVSAFLDQQIGSQPALLDALQSELPPALSLTSK